MFPSSIVMQCVVLLMQWNGVLCAESKAFQAPLSPLPSPPRPDGVSLGPLMNIDMRGLG